MLSLVSFAEMRQGDEGVVRGANEGRLRPRCDALYIMLCALDTTPPTLSSSVGMNGDRDGGITECPDLEVRREAGISFQSSNDQ